ncbi:MAG: nuclear transport factor 2 family protein [Gammaproteobacteria bacterium]
MVCAAVTLAAGQNVPKKSAPVAKPAATADVQQILKDRFREYTEALTTRDLAALNKIWAEGYTFTNGRGEFLTKKDRMENIKSGATQFDSVSREDEEIRVFGNTAVVTGRVVLKVIYSGKEKQRAILLHQRLGEDAGALADRCQPGNAYRAIAERQLLVTGAHWKQPDLGRSASRNYF